MKLYFYVICLFVFSNSIISAQTFTVDSNGDTADASAGDGNCDDGAGNCTLRAAIEEANATGGASAITIDFSTGMTITPASLLPTLTRTNVTIDGSTVAGASCGTLVSGTTHTLSVIIDGGSLPTVADDLFTISTTDCTIRGLVIQNSRDMGIVITDDNNAVECCYIGTNQAGTAAAGNTDHGIFINGTGAVTGTTVSNCLISGNSASGIHIGGIDEITATGNLIGTNAAGSAAIANNVGISCFGCTNMTIGGSNATDRNIISGNTNAGYNSGGTGTSNVSFFGNYIGTDITGENDLGNGAEGIRMQHPASNYTIGGSSAGQGNVISGNGDDGIHLNDDATVLGNKIGTDKDGISNIGNDDNGIFIQSVGTDNTIGGNSSADENIIAFNGADGIEVNSFTTTVNNEIARNSIFSNNNLGIDLGEDGASANDVGDGDAGANNLQNTPEISSAGVDGSNNVTVTYLVNSTTGNSSYPLTIRFYKADAGNEEGQSYLGEHLYTIGNAQNSVMTTFAAVASVSMGDVIVATATDANGNTSEFSASASLPVDLVYFRVETSGKDAILKWQTQMEINNEGFEIQHFLKGDWLSIDFVSGYGDSFEPRNYQFTIPNLLPGSHQFRLKQVDFDGRVDYSEVVEVYIQPEGDKLKVYPNPTHGELNIALDLEHDQEVRMELLDFNGRNLAVLYDGFWASEEQQWRVSDLSTFKKGYYIIQVIGVSFVKTERIVLVGN